jgi:anti-sigma regulatory factor (Ser/Thr protein kinase)
MARSSFAPELPSAEAARRFVEGELRVAAVDEETLFRVQLLTTELVTNAVRHANSCVELTVAQREDRVPVEARDDSPQKANANPSGRPDSPSWTSPRRGSLR